MLDQILASRGLLTGDRGLSVAKESATVVKSLGTNKQKAPRRFGRPSSGVNPEGTSDHWAVGVEIGLRR